MGIQFYFVNRQTTLFIIIFASLPCLPSWLLPWLSPLDPQLLMVPLPHTMPLLLITPLLTQHPSMTNHPNLMLSNTVFPMITPEPNSTLKRPLTAKPFLDLTKLLFPMVVSKPSPTPLITTTDMSLMSNTKVPPSTQRPNLTTQHPLPDITLKKLSLQV